ncbi:hypothetical protein [Microbacterium sp. Leaf151]|uniref:hypothetical protein n=1 Tax=Microbacterium sp. Leaf151 TaxID=1736276 RepID=UPI0006F6FD55|nr:hypothetical protein [Microbacterium sp. Leaf151]KQR23230.1 hypothetical protein ASF76_08400 [Microbacterium sp. Leaf151]
MTPLPPPSPRRGIDVLGIVAVCLASLVVLPTLAVVLIGLIPEMNGIWWLGIVLLPLLVLDGALVVVIAVIGVVVGVRRRGPRAMSIVAVVVGILMLLPPFLLWVGSAI